MATAPTITRTVTFSSPESLNLDFSADQAGVELFYEQTATLAHVPE